MSDNEPLKLDEAGPVRDSEKLDTDRLTSYLESHLGALTGTPELRQFRKGHSNLTYLLRFGDGEGERELVLRRPPFGKKIETAHDMSREFRILSALHGGYGKVPRPLLYCDDEAVIGAPFYVMERVRGVILRGPQPEVGVELTAPLLRSLSTALVDHLAELHAVDIDRTELADIGRPEGYVQRQIDGWTKRYFAAKTDEIPELEAAASWLADHRPADSGAALIHGDFKYDNLVLDPDDLTNIVAVLDWEMATVGDPLMDLGTALGYWVDVDDPDEVKMFPLGPTAREGSLNRRQVVERYVELTGREIGDIVFYYVYGLFKLAVIAQQIYKRFKDGFSKDHRFGMFIYAVRILGEAASRAIDRGRIDRLA